MKKVFKLFFCVLYVGLSLCQGQSEVSKRNAYLQHIRAQKFLEIKRDAPKLNENYSVDLDEFDAYEADEIPPFQIESSNGSSSSSTKKKEKLQFKDIESGVNDIELLKEEQEKINLIGGKTCTVSEKGVLDVSINSTDIFNAKKYIVELSTNSINLIDVNNSNTIIKNIPYETIKLPIETIEETRECWQIKTNKDKYFFCEKKKADRDIWVTNILKALFCYNTNILIIEKNKKDISITNVTIPKESTIDQRIRTSK